MSKTDDGVGRHVYKYGIYEKDITSLVLSIPFEDGDIFIDVGANIGWYSLLVSVAIPKSVKVYSFEPEPFNYDFLLRNITLNEAQNIVPVKKALGDKEGVVNFYLYPNSNRGRHTVLPLYNYKVIQVPITTLDKFSASEGIERVKLIKIDVEGFEYMVLKGALKTLEVTDFVVLEVTPDYMKRGGINYHEFIEFLDSLNFEYYLIDKVDKDGLKRITPQDLLFVEKGVNLFLCRKGVSPPTLKEFSRLTGHQKNDHVNF